jgi:hypothetical protein
MMCVFASIFISRVCTSAFPENPRNFGKKRKERHAYMQTPIYAMYITRNMKREGACAQATPILMEK